MKRTMNKVQKSYMNAKARVQEVESQQEAIEKKYISDNGIVNPDGSVPEFLYCMDDDAAFEKANDEFPVRRSHVDRSFLFFLAQFQIN